MTRLLLFGATGTAGQGVLREAIKDSAITSITSIARRTAGADSPKVTEILLKDPSDISSVIGQLRDVDACCYCLGISANGLSEKEYTTITKDMTLRVSDALKAARPDMRFMYISGQGSDAKARAMWARVKGETENELLARWGQQATMFRPGLIEPEGGIPGQNSLLYKLMYKAAPVLKTIGLPVVGTTALGKAMLAAAKAPRPTEKRILENADILALAGSA